MYDQQARKWRSDCESEELLRWCREPANSGRPEACFLRASHLLSQGSCGEHLSEAMALLEQAGDYPDAICARGQLCQFGWGVHKDKKEALEWYRRAAALGSQQAKEALAKLRKRRLIAVGSLLAAAVCVCLVITLLFVMARAAQRIIKVHPVSQLLETVTGEEYRKEIRDLIAQYDTDEVIAGEACTNRVVLEFEGNRLDLSGYEADKVIAMEDNRVVLQFSSEDEARRCIEELSKLDTIIYVEMDEYIMQANTFPRADGTGQQNGHYSWGVVDLGMDQLSAYVAENYGDRELIVAVVDSGVMPWEENLPRILEGQNMVTGKAGTSLPASHGTHVAGTILDGTKGTGVKVLAVDVFNGEGGASTQIVADGVDYAVEQGASVINMSLGGSEPGHASIKERAIQRAVDAGVTVVVAAGNDTADATTYCPSCVDEAIVVAAYNIEREDAWFSNWGDSVDVCAPGVDIISDGCYLTEEEALAGGIQKKDVQNYVGRYVSKNGTSMACPHITALAGLMRILYPDAAPAQIEQYIKDYCKDYGLSSDYGEGIPNATAFIEN